MIGSGCPFFVFEGAITLIFGVNILGLIILSLCDNNLPKDRADVRARFLPMTKSQGLPRAIVVEYRVCAVEARMEDEP